MVFILITYDIVSNPSHAKARVLEFLPENYSLGSDDDSQMALVCESDQSDVLFLEEQDRITISRKNEPFEKSFVESILQDKFESALKGLKFKF